MRGASAQKEERKESMRFAKLTCQEAAEQAGLGPAEAAEALRRVGLPTRATRKSAGYDFQTPFAVDAKAGDVVRIPLLVKVEGMPEGVVLLLFNRSGLSLKRKLRLDNAVGVVDADYPDGIVFQATAGEDIKLAPGDRICQGIFFCYLHVEGDAAKEERTGGFGSTGA